MRALRGLSRLVSGCGAALVCAFSLVLFLSCGADRPAGPTTPDSFRSPGNATLVGAGDIALCGKWLEGAQATARLLDAIPGTIFTTGDNVQDRGTAEEFEACFGPTWGRHRGRIRPSPGNHDYLTASAGPYFDYFGANAGPAGLGYYSYDLGAWHIVSLNTNLDAAANSQQIAWLRADLEANRDRLCTAAYWHQPLMSSGTTGPTKAVRELWNVLYEFGAEIVMNGHEHMYDRYAPQDPSGKLDPVRGIRQFIVGTGGAYVYGAARHQPNSEVLASVFGVLKLTLRPDGYDWEFISVPGANFSDRGSATCH
ncbi:MAG: metallophosphoesterase [Vicinamibacterales bacterium]